MRNTSPMLWGAGLACALGGAVAGTALGSTPLLDRAAVGAFLPDEGSASAGQPPAEIATPDHYPLVTPRGTVPVEQLSDRGLYSQARYRPVTYQPPVPEMSQASYQPPSTDVAYQPAAKVSYQVQAGSPPKAANLPPDAVAPLPLSNGPATVASAGQAKTVDVRAALAMQ